MSEFRKGRKRFISRDPSKANSQWKEGYNGKAIATGSNVAATSKNDAIFLQPTFDLRTADQVNCGQYTGSSTCLSSLKQRSTDQTSPNSHFRSGHYSSRPSDTGKSDDVFRSRDRSALRVVTVDNKTRIGTERRMASEMGFRPILRRHGSNSSSSSDSPSIKDNGTVTAASSKTTLCPVALLDLRPAPTASMPPNSASQKTESVAGQGTFLTLPANADSMQVQIKDTKISITRVPDQAPAATPRLRTLSAEYDNVPETVPSPSVKEAHAPQGAVPPAAFAPSSSQFESPGQLSPVRGLRLVPSPNSAFTKTKVSKASEAQVRSEYAEWAVPALSLGSGRGPLELERSTRGQPEQTPIDFNLIFSGIGLRPLDLEDFAPEKRKTFRALKSCSLENIPAVDGKSGKTTGRTNRACANDSSEHTPSLWLGKTGTNKVDAPPNSSKATGQSSVFISQTTSLDNQSKPKRLLTTEVDILPQRNYIKQSSSKSQPITDAFTIIGQHPSTVQQPIRDSLSSKASTDPITSLSKPDAQPITDGPTNLFTSTVVQPIASSRQSFWAASTGPITSASNACQPIKNESCRSSTGPASRPITVSTKSFGKVNVSTYILPPSLGSITSAAAFYSPPEVTEGVSLAEPTMASAMSSLEKAISMLNSVAMDTSAPGVPMEMLSTIATDTESLAKSFQLEASAVGGTGFANHLEKPSGGREMVLPPGMTIEGNKDMVRTGPTPDMVEALLENFEYPVREDAVLTLTLNLLDQTLAEIHQEFPPGRRPSAGKTPKPEAGSSTLTPGLSRFPETTPSSKRPWEASVSSQPKNSSTHPEMHWDTSGSRIAGDISESERCLRRILDRQDSFNRPGSSLFRETLPLPKESVIQRYRRKKKNKSSASPSSSPSSSSSSTSSSSREDGDGNGAAGAKRSPRQGRRQTRRQRMASRAEDGAAAGAAAGENKTKSRNCHRRRRAEEEQCDKEQYKQTYKHADIQESRSTAYTLSNNLNSVSAAVTVIPEQSLVAETWLTLASGPVQDLLSLKAFDLVYPSAKPSLETATDHSASIDIPSHLLVESKVEEGGASLDMIGTIYANSDSERAVTSAVHRSFRNLGKNLEEDGDMASRLSPLRTSASSPRNQPTSVARSHSSGSCSPADTSARTKNLTPFSHHSPRRLAGEKRSSPATIEEQVINEQHPSHRHHHQSSSSDRLSAASADEEVFLVRMRQSVSPSQKLSDDASQSGIGRLKVRIRSKESISSGAHGYDHRKTTASPQDHHQERVQSDGDRGPREGSFTGSVRLTLKQKSEDLTDDPACPQKIRTVSTRTNSSADDFPVVIRAQSKAVSYESICLKIKEESPENQKTIHVISLTQPSNPVTTSKTVLLELAETDCGPETYCRNPPCSASQLCNLQHSETVSSKPVQRDHSTKHRSTVFFSSKKSTSGSHTNLSQVEPSADMIPNQVSKVGSLPVKLIQHNSGKGTQKSEYEQPAQISERHKQKRSEKVIALNKKCHDDALHTTSTQVFTKKGDPQKAMIVGRTDQGTTPDESLSKRESRERASLHFDESLNRIGKESKFVLKRDQQPMSSSSQMIMGTVFTDRHNPRQNLNFPGTDLIQKDNSGRTSESKTSQSSKSVPQVSAHKIVIKQNSRPVVEKNQVPENNRDVLVGKAKLAADGSAQMSTIFSQDSGGRIKCIQPVAATQDNSKFSSSFLCSLSKFSQPPAESVSTCTPRPKPISISSSSSSTSFSRVDWAKQRLGQAPENKSSVTTVLNQSKMKDSAPLEAHQPETVHHQIHNTGVTITATSRQDRSTYADGDHINILDRQELPSVKESSSATDQLPLPVTAQDVTISQTPLVSGPIGSTTSFALSASKQLPQTSIPLASETQHPATTGNFATGSLKVFIQSPHPTAVLKRTSLLVPYIHAPLSDIKNSQSSASQSSANSKVIRSPELELQFYGSAESIDSFRKPDSDSTDSVRTAPSSVSSEDVVVRAFVCEPVFSDVCALLVEETTSIVTVESVIPDDNRVVLLPIDDIPCQEQPLLETTTSDFMNKSALDGTSSSHSSQDSSKIVAIGKAKIIEQVTEDPLKVIIPYYVEAGGENMKVELSPSDSLECKFESDVFLRESRLNCEDDRTVEELSPNEFDQRQSPSDYLSLDTHLQGPGRGLYSMEQIDSVEHDFNVVDSETNLSPLNRNPESFEPSGASQVTKKPMVTRSHDDQAEITSESTAETSRSQRPNPQRELLRDLAQPYSKCEISASRNPAMARDNRRGSDGTNESLMVSTRDAEIERVLGEDQRAKRTDQIIEPEMEDVRGRLAKTQGIPTQGIIKENSAMTSSLTTTISSSAEATSSTKATPAVISVTKAQDADTFSQSDSSSDSDDDGSFVHTDSPVEYRDAFLQFPLPETTKTDLGIIGLMKNAAEKEKSQRCVRFQSRDELMEYSPIEFSSSGPMYSPLDAQAEKHCPLLNKTESHALGVSAAIGKPAVMHSPDSNLLEDTHLKSPRKDPEVFEDLHSKFPRKDSETSSVDSSKASPPSAVRTAAKPCIVRKQLIHLDSALHPSSCVPPESKPVEARWSPKLVRKLNLAEAKDVDVSDLDVAPDLMDFLSKEMEKVSGDAKQQQSTHGETKDELETGTQELPSLSVKRKPPLSLSLKPAEREEDAQPSSASAADRDEVKPEAEVGKRKFFSALKANATSFRAKKTTFADEPSPDKSHLDRLASFALISDVGIATKRRQFQKQTEPSLSSINNSICVDPTTDAHAKLSTPDSSPSTDRIQRKGASFPVLSSSDDKAKTRLGRGDESETRLRSKTETTTRLGRADESETRLRTETETKTRLGGGEARLDRPEVDSDDDFDKLVEINFRQLVDEKSGTVGVRPVSMEQPRNQTGTGLAGGTAGVGGQQKVMGSRRQLARFKTQPVTMDEVDTAREIALHKKNKEK